MQLLPHYKKEEERGNLPGINITRRRRRLTLVSCDNIGNWFFVTFPLINGGGGGPLSHILASLSLIFFAANNNSIRSRPAARQKSLV